MCVCVCVCGSLDLVEGLERVIILLVLLLRGGNECQGCMNEWDEKDVTQKHIQAKQKSWKVGSGNEARRCGRQEGRSTSASEARWALGEGGTHVDAVIGKLLLLDHHLPLLDHPLDIVLQCVHLRNPFVEVLLFLAVAAASGACVPGRVRLRGCSREEF